MVSVASEGASRPPARSQRRNQGRGYVACARVLAACPATTPRDRGQDAVPTKRLPARGHSDPDGAHQVHYLSGDRLPEVSSPPCPPGSAADRRTSTVARTSRPTLSKATRRTGGAGARRRTSGTRSAMGSGASSWRPTTSSRRRSTTASRSTRSRPPRRTSSDPPRRPRKQPCVSRPALAWPRADLRLYIPGGRACRPNDENYRHSPGLALAAHRARLGRVPAVGAKRDRVAHGRPTQGQGQGCRPCRSRPRPRAISECDVAAHQAARAAGLDAPAAAQARRRRRRRHDRVGRGQLGRGRRPRRRSLRARRPDRGKDLVHPRRPARAHAIVQAPWAGQWEQPGSGVQCERRARTDARLQRPERGHLDRRQGAGRQAVLRRSRGALFGHS